MAHRAPFCGIGGQQSVASGAVDLRSSARSNLRRRSDVYQ